MADVHRSFLAVGVDVSRPTPSAPSVSSWPSTDSKAGWPRSTWPPPASPARPPTTPPPPNTPAGWPATSGRAPSFPTLGQIPYADLRDAYEEQAAALLEGGVDLLIIETVFDLLQAKAAMNGCPPGHGGRRPRVPLQVQVTIELTGRMLPGTEIGAALTALEAMRPDVIGLNCATGPAEMGEPSATWPSTPRLPVAVQPNAGLPTVVDGAMHYDLTPEQLADHHARFVTELGVIVVGGCCGTTPEHLRRRGRRVPRPRARPTPAPNTSRPPPPSTPPSPSTRTPRSSWSGNGPTPTARSSSATPCSSADWDTCVAMARDQVKEGAHILDVCVDYTGADGVADMEEVASPLRHPVHRAADGRLHRGPGRGDRPAWIGGRADHQLGQPRRGRRPRAPASTRS